MHGTGNQENPQEVILSLEQMKNLMTLIMSQTQVASKKDVNEIKEIITQFSFIKEKFKDIDLSLEQLRSAQISQGEIWEASDEVFSIVSDEGTQRNIAKSVDQKLVDKFKNLPPAKKALVESGLIGAAGAITPIAIVGAAIAIPVALVALPLVLLYTGLKRAMPSKEEFKKTWQETKKDVAHGIKNLANKAPGETNLEKLWKSIHKPGVTSENPNLKEFLTKYCFPNQESGKQVKVKFDPDKIEALKYVADEMDLKIKVSEDKVEKKVSELIGRMVKKGESKFNSDYVKNNKGEIDTQFIRTISDVVTKVMAKDHLIEDKFKDKLTEVKQAKEEEKAGEKKNSFLNKVKDKFQRSSSHTEGIEEGRRGSNSSQGRST